MAANRNKSARWQSVRFGDVVRNCTDAERDPLAAGFERYVGLEHIEPECLKIKSWGLVADGTSFTRVFREGQILFAKRRAYQRKVAVADFGGICSSDVLVFEPKGEDLIPGLLPFIVQSDGFFDHALGTSAGSLSPRTRWSQLKEYEFLLPPKDEQRRIAGILWAAEEAIGAARKVMHDVVTARKAFVERVLDGLDSQEHVALKELWTKSPSSGHSPSAAANETGHYVLTLSALSDRGYQRGYLKPVRLDNGVKETILSRGDLLVSRSNTTELVGLVGIFDEDRTDVSFPDLMMRVEVDEKSVNKQYLELVMLSRRGRTHMQRVAAGTSGSMKKINRTGLGAFMLPLPSLAQQTGIVAQVRSFVRAARDAAARTTSLNALKKNLLDECLAAPTRWSARDGRR